jgi:hypothetical protein
MNNFSFIGNILLSIFLLVSTLDAVELNWEHNYDNANIVKGLKSRLFQTKHS